MARILKQRTHLGKDPRRALQRSIAIRTSSQWSVLVELVPPGVVSTPWASLRLLSRVTTMPASARLAHAADPGAIWYQFNQYTPLVAPIRIDHRRAHESDGDLQFIRVTIAGADREWVFLRHGRIIRIACNHLFGKIRRENVDVV